MTFDPQTNIYTTGTDQTIGHIHMRDAQCDISCVIHNPSDHTMKDWPTNWRDDRRLMERICPHGVGHPDPDQVAFRIRNYGDESGKDAMTHGCDGCCEGAYDLMKTGTLADSEWIANE